MVKIGVVIPARNEEKVLPQTLQNLFTQTLKPKTVVLVNDGSTDRTSDIGRQFGCVVVNLPKRDTPVIGLPRFAAVKNVGLSVLRKEDLDYVMILDADHKLPTDYIERIVERMNREANLVVASGIIKGEKSTRTSVRDSGRVIKVSFWKLIGYAFPEKYGGESWILYKALQMGYNVKSFDDIVSEARPTSLGWRKCFGEGKSMKALGYFWVNALWRCLETFLKNQLAGIAMTLGYFSKVEYLETAKWLNREQKKRFIYKVKNLLRVF